MTATLCIVLMGSLLLGAVTGFLGVFPFLRQQSLLSDALSHAMLPGIAASFLISGGKQGAFLLCGGIVGGCAAAWIFMILQRYTRLKQDALLGILLSSFFGLGLLFVTAIQKKAYANSAIVQRFFFGNASTIVSEDIWTIIILGIMCITVILCLWKETKLVLFDSLYAQTLGYPVVLIERVLTGIFVITLAMGLSLVGVVLMSSFLIAPVAAGRQWVQSMCALCVLSSCIGAFSGAFGVLMSSYYHYIPTGPLIVVILSVLVFFSLVFSPTRGVLRYWFS